MVAKDDPAASVRVAYPDTLLRMRECFPDADELDLIRFLRARACNFSRAEKMFAAHTQWRQDTLPILETDRLKETLASRKFYLLDSPDAQGRPVVVVSLRRFMNAKYDVDDEIEAYLFMMENQLMPRVNAAVQKASVGARERMGADTLSMYRAGQWTVLIDVSGIRMPPSNFLIKLNTVFEANYPERLHRTVMFPVPWFVQQIITSMLWFVDKGTQQKFRYVNDLRELERQSGMGALWHKGGLRCNDVAECIISGMLKGCEEADMAAAAAILSDHVPNDAVKAGYEGLQPGMHSCTITIPANTTAFHEVLVPVVSVTIEDTNHEEQASGVGAGETSDGWCCWACHH